MADDKKKKGGKDEGGASEAPKAKPQLDEAEVAKKRAERAAKKAGKGGGGASETSVAGGATGEKPGPARLRLLFDKEIGPSLMKELALKNRMQLPKLRKITINMGLGEAVSNPKILDSAVE